MSKNNNAPELALTMTIDSEWRPARVRYGFIVGGSMAPSINWRSAQGRTADELCRMTLPQLQALPQTD